MALLMFVAVMIIAIIAIIIFKIIGYQNNYMNMNDMVSPSVYYDSIIGIVIALFLIGLSYLRLTEEQA